MKDNVVHTFVRVKAQVNEEKEWRIMVTKKYQHLQWE
jgi:hypothetical protein